MRINSFDPETGTFSAVAATETPVLRSDFFDGDFYEILSLAPKAVRLDRLSAGRAPILDSHRMGSSKDQLGVVTAAHIEGKKLIIEGRLSARDDVRQIATDIAAGVIRNVSVGYRVHASTEAKGPNGSRTITRTDWEPMEVSIVPMGADSEAHIRSAKGTKMATRPKTRTVVIPRAAAVAAPASYVVDDDAELIDDDDDDVTTEVRSAPAVHSRPAMSPRDVRLARSSVAAFGLSEDFANRCIADGMPLDQVRIAAQNEAARSAPPRQVPHHRATPASGDEELGNAIVDAIHGRMTGKAPEGRGAELMGRSLIEMGTMLLESRGERVTFGSRDQVAKQIMTRGGQHSTSDFPTLLKTSGGRVMIDAYKAAETPLKMLARRRDAIDFRALSTVKLSEAPKLLEVKEGGEVKYGSRGEAKESFRVKTFARIYGLTREAIVNDDLGAFADTSAAWGRSAAELEADQLVGLLTANSGNGTNLDDGNPIYTTTRGNKAASGTAIDETNLSAARQALRETKGLDGVTPLSGVPKYLLVGPERETQAEKMLTLINAAEAANVNPFAGKLSLLVEPRISGKSWRLFTDPANIPVLAMAYLSGQEGPQIEVKEGWDVLGTEFRCVLDFGCGVTEWRGTYLNAGA